MNSKKSIAIWRNNKNEENAESLSVIENRPLSSRPGIYIFRDNKGRVLYIGKAASLKTRVSSYFAKNRDQKAIQITGEAKSIDCQETDSALEALILEANLIKKYQPKYNVRSKDGKDFVQIIITQEDYPSILVVRPGKEPKNKKFISYGPYTSAKLARRALEIIRKILPFRQDCKIDKNKKGCFDYQLGLCPGSCAGSITKKDYGKTVKRIKLILGGKIKTLLSDLEIEMKKAAKAKKFEGAAGLRDQLFAFRHIQDISLIANKEVSQSRFRRIEAYDISNIGGELAVGSMVVFQDGKARKDDYRRFKIKTPGLKGDTSAMAEILKRRLERKDWPLPDLIFVDGGASQFNVAIKVMKSLRTKLPLVALAKGPKRKGIKIYSTPNVNLSKKFLKEISDEAHRFAINYHRLLRKKKMWI